MGNYQVGQSKAQSLAERQRRILVQAQCQQPLNRRGIAETKATKIDGWRMFPEELANNNPHDPKEKQ